MKFLKSGHTAKDSILQQIHLPSANFYMQSILQETP